jgi:retron-type reverse transcriptase
MKRAGNLWPEIVSWDNLLNSALCAARGKRNRPDVASFLFQLEPKVCALQRELEAGEYVPGEYRTFWIHDPKARLISAAPFRDRVVHHALTRVLEKVFEPRFMPNSYASRKGFGQHQALTRARQAVGRYKYVLKCDVRKYFPSIDHEILKELLERVVKCKPTLNLAARIIDGSNAREESLAWFAGDNLFTPVERRRGLPIGNQTSQFFANVYLNVLDHFAMRELRPGLYLRYVDDFVLFGDDKAELGSMRSQVQDLLEQLRLNLNGGKSRVYRCADGLSFLGWRLFPGRARLKRRNVVNFRRRLRNMRDSFRAGRIDFPGVERRIAAWLGQASFGDTRRLREELFDGFTLIEAEHGRRARGLLEQQSTECPGLEP